ncbi:MAG: carotenoid biosynthesis protein [Cryomorphaceae bacterium]
MAVYLVSTETPKNKLTYILPVVLGFAIEVVGTNTGWPFGEYTYGSALGLSIANTPLMIGVLWWLLIRSMYDVLSVKISSVWTKSLLVGVAMTAMDVLIEPVAIELNFWSWEGESVPMSNYIAWFVLSALFTRITASGHAKNPMSLWVLMVLNVFFTILCLRY